MFYKFMLGVAKWLIFPFLHLFNRLEIEGLENIPEKGPIVLASNHLSLWDPVYLFCCVQRKLNFMAKAELFDIPVVGWVIRHVNAFPVNRHAMDRTALRLAGQALAREEGLVIFPEGTRSQSGELLPFYDGAALFAHRSNALTIPVAIMNSPKTFPKGFRQRIKIRFGSPLDFNEFEGEKTSAEMLKKMTNTLWHQVHQLQSQEVLDENHIS